MDTPWKDYPDVLERKYYDVKYWDGQIIERLLQTRQGFYCRARGPFADELVIQVRISLLQEPWLSPQLG